MAVGYQTAPERKESAVSLAFEYGITDKLMWLVEAVIYTAIRPDVGAKGDLESKYSG